MVSFFGCCLLFFFLLFFFFFSSFLSLKSSLSFKLENFLVSPLDFLLITRFCPYSFSSVFLEFLFLLIFSSLLVFPICATLAYIYAVHGSDWSLGHHFLLIFSSLLWVFLGQFMSVYIRYGYGKWKKKEDNPMKNNKIKLYLYFKLIIIIFL